MKKLILHLILLWHKVDSKCRPYHYKHRGCQRTEDLEEFPVDQQVEFLNNLIMKVVHAPGFDDGDKLALILMIRKAISLRIS